jgi:hypothetical protein
MTSIHLFDPKKSKISDFFPSSCLASYPAWSEATEGHLAEGTFPFAAFALGLASWHHVISSKKHEQNTTKHQGFSQRLLKTPI